MLQLFIITYSNLITFIIKYLQVLHYAVLSGNLAIVNLMIKQGAKLNYDEVYDLGKPSPLDLAILKGDPQIVELLIKSGEFIFCFVML